MAISWKLPWLLLLFLPVAWMMWSWWKRENRFGMKKKRLILISRILIFTVLILALARTELLSPIQHQSVVFVVDRSASIQNPDAITPLIREAVKEKKAEDQFAIISVGSAPVVEQSFTTSQEVDSLSAVVNRNATDLESGLRLAGGMLPADARGRVVLITDGKETQGSAEAEARALRQRGIRVDVIPLAEPQGAEVLVSDFQVPKRIYAGEEATIRVKIYSTVDTEAALRLYQTNQLLTERKIHLQQGENQYSLQTRAKDSGFLRYRVEIQSDQDTLSNNNQAYGFSQVQGQPSVLVVEGKQGEAANLVSALTSTSTHVDQIRPAALPVTLEGYKKYSSIVLVNTPAYDIPEHQMKIIQAAVKDLGVGLVMTGGEEGFALGGWFQTPIEEVLPVHMDLKDKNRLPSLGLILVIDKSGSMAGEKIELAKEAAIRATQMLTPHDQLGVLSFDSQNQWVFKPESVQNRNQMQAKIGGIPADGGTNIYPALEDAYQEVRKLKVKRKHIILLTDGQSHGGAYQELAEKLKKEGITLSTVAVGQDADQALMQNLAQWAGGRYYLADSAGSIPTIFSKETSIATRSYIVDEPFIPKWVGGIDWQQKVPPLRAYIATSPKQTAEMVLASPYPDPILARWQYGLGRTVAWTSDLNGKWSSAWVKWAGFPQFWNQVVSWTFPQYDTSGLYLDSKIEGNQVRLEAKAPPGQFKDVEQIQFTVMDDQLKSKQVSAKAVAPGQFVGHFEADQPGTYLLQATDRGKMIGSFGLSVPYSPEYVLADSGKELAQKIAAQGGGNPLANPGQAFADNLDSKWSGQDISLLLLLLAALLWPVDIAIRRLSISKEDLIRIKNRFSRQASVAEASYTEQIGNLQQKARQAIEKRTEETAIGAEFSRERLQSRKADEKVGPLMANKKPETPEPNSQPQPAKTEIPKETHTSRLLAAKRKRNQSQG